MKCSKTLCKLLTVSNPFIGFFRIFCPQIIYKKLSC